MKRKKKIVVHQWASSVKPALQLSINACRDLCEWTMNASWNKSADDALMKFRPVGEPKGVEYCCCVRSRWISLFHQSHRGYCAGVKLLSLSLSPTPPGNKRASVLTRWKVHIWGGGGLPAAHTSADSSRMNFHSNSIFNGLGSKEAHNQSRARRILALSTSTAL